MLEYMAEQQSQDWQWSTKHTTPSEAMSPCASWTPSEYVKWWFCVWWN